jgi:ADP-ribosylglycohydrolase
MRVAPLGFCLDPGHPEQAITFRDVCRITHHNDEAWTGAAAVVLAVRAVAIGGWRPGDNLARTVADGLADTAVRDRLRAVGELDPATPIAEVACRFGASGFVAESVPLAIFSAQRIGREHFQEVVRAVVEAGGDTDTNASITGQIAGAAIGLGGIAAELVRRLPENEKILEAARHFAAVITTLRPGRT